MEAFRARGGKKDTEVLFMYQNPIDDFVMTNLGTYNNRKLVTAEVGSLDIGNDDSTADDESKSDDEGKSSSAMDDTNVKALSDWLMDVALPGKLSTVKVRALPWLRASANGTPVTLPPPAHRGANRKDLHDFCSSFRSLDPLALCISPFS